MAGSIVTTKTQHKPRGLVRLKVAVTTDSSGNVTAAKIGDLWGKIVGIAYAAGDLATGVDITVTDALTGATVFSLTNAGTAGRFLRPTQIVTDSAGVAITAATTAVDVNRDIYVAGQLKLGVAQGGDTKSGSLTFLCDEGAA